MKQITIGAVLGVHGVRGDLKIKPLVDNDKIFVSLKAVILRDKEGICTEREVSKARFHCGAWLIKLASVDTPELGLTLKGSQLLIPESALPETTDDEVYWIHIKGLPVVDATGVRIGVLDDLLETGAHDVFQIAGDDGKVYLISNNPEHVLKIDLENKQVVIDRIGLVD